MGHLKPTTDFDNDIVDGPLGARFVQHLLDALGALRTFVSCNYSLGRTVWEMGHDQPVADVQRVLRK